MIREARRGRCPDAGYDSFKTGKGRLPLVCESMIGKYPLSAATCGLPIQQTVVNLNEGRKVAGWRDLDGSLRGKPIDGLERVSPSLA